MINNNIFKWYMISVRSGREKQALEMLKSDIKIHNLEQYVEDYLAPTERKIITISGKKVSRESMVFSGYIMAKLSLNGELIRTIKKSTYVANIVGTDGVPTPLSDAEVSRIVDNIEKSHSIKSYIIGDSVKIIDGAFASFNGNVLNVDENKKEIEISVLILGRETKIKISMDKCEKINI